MNKLVKNPKVGECYVLGGDSVFKLVSIDKATDTAWFEYVSGDKGWIFIDGHMPLMASKMKCYERPDA